MKNINLKFALMMVLAVGSLSEVATASHGAASAIHNATTSSFVTGQLLHDFELPVGEMAEDFADSRQHSINLSNKLIDLNISLEGMLEEADHDFELLTPDLESVITSTDIISKSAEIKQIDLQVAMKDINKAFRQIKVMSQKASKDIKKINTFLPELKTIRKQVVESAKKAESSARKAVRAAKL